MEPVIDLVAVAYRAMPETARFLQSVSSQIALPFTLTVVENKTPEQKEMRSVLRNGMAQVVESPHCVAAKIVFNDENAGYARACNHGAALGSAPYLALLNCDTQFFAGSEALIAVEFERNPDVAIIGPRTIDDQNRLTHAGIVRKPNGRDEHLFWMQPDRGQASHTADVPTVSGATYFVRRSVWDELTKCDYYQSVARGAEGAFLPTQHFYEETWCSYHAHAHGYKVRYLGEALMRHDWHRSSPPGSIPMVEAERYFREACRVHGIGLTF